MPDFLKNIADGMKRQARAHPGVVVRPAPFRGKALGELPQGAHLHLMFFPEPMLFWLRIGRKGLAPENDFSPNGLERARKRDNEVKTFLRDFGAGVDAQKFHGAQELYYFTDCYWPVVVRPDEPAGGNDDTAVFQKNVAGTGPVLAAPRLLGE